jgi:hypothetical protein
MQVCHPEQSAACNHKALCKPVVKGTGSCRIRGHLGLEREQAAGEVNAGHKRAGYNLPMKLEALILNSIVLSVTIRSTGTL